MNIGVIYKTELNADEPYCLISACDERGEVRLTQSVCRACGMDISDFAAGKTIVTYEAEYSDKGNFARFVGACPKPNVIEEDGNTLYEYYTTVARLSDVECATGWAELYSPTGERNGIYLSADLYGFNSAGIFSMDIITFAAGKTVLYIKAEDNGYKSKIYDARVMSASAADENDDIPFDVSIDTFSQADDGYRLSNDINDEIRVTAEDCERFGIDTSRIALKKTVFLVESDYDNNVTRLEVLGGLKAAPAKPQQSETESAPEAQDGEVFRSRINNVGVYFAFITAHDGGANIFLNKKTCAVSSVDFTALCKDMEVEYTFETAEDGRRSAKWVRIVSDENAETGKVSAPEKPQQSETESASEAQDGEVFRSRINNVGAYFAFITAHDGGANIYFNKKTCELCSVDFTALRRDMELEYTFETAEDGKRTAKWVRLLSDNGTATQHVVPSKATFTDAPVTATIADDDIRRKVEFSLQKLDTAIKCGEACRICKSCDKCFECYHSMGVSLEEMTRFIVEKLGINDVPNVQWERLVALKNAKIADDETFGMLNEFRGLRNAEAHGHVELSPDKVEAFSKFVADKKVGAIKKWFLETAWDERADSYASSNRSWLEVLEIFSKHLPEAVVKAIVLTVLVRQQMCPVFAIKSGINYCGVHFATFVRMCKNYGADHGFLVLLEKVSGAESMEHFAQINANLIESNRNAYAQLVRLFEVLDISAVAGTKCVEFVKDKSAAVLTACEKWSDTNWQLAKKAFGDDLIDRQKAVLQELVKVYDTSDTAFHSMIDVREKYELNQDISTYFTAICNDGYNSTSLSDNMELIKELLRTNNFHGNYLGMLFDKSISDAEPLFDIDNELVKECRELAIELILQSEYKSESQNSGLMKVIINNDPSIILELIKKGCINDYVWVKFLKTVRNHTFPLFLINLQKWTNEIVVNRECRNVLIKKMHSILSKNRTVLKMLYSTSEIRYSDGKALVPKNVIDSALDAMKRIAEYSKASDELRSFISPDAAPNTNVQPEERAEAPSDEPNEPVIAGDLSRYAQMKNLVRAKEAVVDGKQLRELLKFDKVPMANALLVALDYEKIHRDDAELQRMFLSFVRRISMQNFCLRDTERFLVDKYRFSVIVNNYRHAYAEDKEGYCNALMKLMQMLSHPAVLNDAKKNSFSYAMTVGKCLLEIWNGLLDEDSEKGKKNRSETYLRLLQQPLNEKALMSLCSVVVTNKNYKHCQIQSDGSYSSYRFSLKKFVRPLLDSSVFMSLSYKLQLAVVHISKPHDDETGVYRRGYEYADEFNALCKQLFESGEYDALDPAIKMNIELYYRDFPKTAESMLERIVNDIEKHKPDEHELSRVYDVRIELMYVHLFIRYSNDPWRTRKIAAYFLASLEKCWTDFLEYMDIENGNRFSLRRTEQQGSYIMALSHPCIRAYAYARCKDLLETVERCEDTYLKGQFETTFDKLMPVVRGIVDGIYPDWQDKVRYYAPELWQLELQYRRNIRYNVGIEDVQEFRADYWENIVSRFKPGDVHFNSTIERLKNGEHSIKLYLERTLSEDGSEERQMFSGCRMYYAWKHCRDRRADYVLEFTYEQPVTLSEHNRNLLAAVQGKSDGEIDRLLDSEPVERLEALLGGASCEAAAESVSASWTCECGTKNEGNFCSGCGKRRPAVKLWRCSCSTENSGNFCTNCGAARPEEWVCRECGARCKGRFCANCGAQYVIVDVPQLN